MSTFTAAFKRDGQEVKQIPNCTTNPDGYLCHFWKGKYAPFWNSQAMEADGLTREQVTQYGTVKAAIDAGMGKYLLKFGKQDGYWIWNMEAAESKKLEQGKTVILYEKRPEDWDDDEPEMRMKDRSYPKEVWLAINPHISKPFTRATYFVVENYTGMVRALEKIGWKTNK
jgi:hypothetical protein